MSRFDRVRAISIANANFQDFVDLDFSSYSKAYNSEYLCYEVSIGSQVPQNKCGSSEPPSPLAQVNIWILNPWSNRVNN